MQNSKHEKRNTNLRIAVVTPGGVTGDGLTRAIPALVQLIDRLAQRHEVAVWTLDRAQPAVSTRGNVTIRRLDTRGTARGLGVLLLTPRLLSELRHGKFDVVHAFWAGTSGAAAMLAARALRVPALLSIGGGELVWLPDIGYGGAGSPRGRLRSTVAVRLANTVTAGSAWAARALSAAVDAAVLPLGIDTWAWSTAAERPGGPPWRLAHVADLNRVKDQHTLLRALRLVLEREPDTLLEIAGHDTLGGAVQSYCAGLGLADRVVFHGRLAQPALKELFGRAHLHVLSSRHESQGVVVAEAAAAGLATAGTRVGSVADLEPDGAVAVPVGDAAALAEAVLALLREPARRERIAFAAQRWAREHDAAWTARRFEQLYDELLAPELYPSRAADRAAGPWPAALPPEEPLRERSDRI